MALMYTSPSFNNCQLRVGLFSPLPALTPPSCINLRHHIISSVNILVFVSE